MFTTTLHFLILVFINLGMGSQFEKGSFWVALAILELDLYPTLASSSDAPASASRVQGLVPQCAAFIYEFLIRLHCFCYIKRKTPLPVHGSKLFSMTLANVGVTVHAV